ncbi:MAG: hypothetical protein WD737_10210 [Gemmatimonadota bacterium]
MAQAALDRCDTGIAPQPPLWGMIRHDAGEVTGHGHAIPREQARAKRDVGFVCHDMNLFGSATLAWHMPS